MNNWPRRQIQVTRGGHPDEPRRGHPCLARGAGRDRDPHRGAAGLHAAGPRVRPDRRTGQRLAQDPDLLGHTAQRPHRPCRRCARRAFPPTAGTTRMRARPTCWARCWPIPTGRPRGCFAASGWTRMRSGPTMCPPSLARLTSQGGRPASPAMLHLGWPSSRGRRWPTGGTGLDSSHRRGHQGRCRCPGHGRGAARSPRR